MTSRKAEEYRRQAQEGFDLARAMSLERDRAILIDIAQTYLRLAKEQEAQEATLSPPPTEQQPQAVAQQQQQAQPKDDGEKE